MSEKQYIRYPKAGEECPITGLRLGTLRALSIPSHTNGGKPPVKSILLTLPGKKKGTRLIEIKSLLAYIKEQGSHNG